MGIDAQMFVRTKNKVTDDEILNWAVQARIRFGELLWVWRDRRYYNKSRHCITRCDEYTQDGPSLKPRVGETFLEVHLSTRYWGPGYERGDLTGILALARWLEETIPSAVIHYGGDSSGVLAEPFDKAAREELWAHFRDNGNSYFTERLDQDGKGIWCDFCKRVPGTFCWGPGDQRGHFCHGCGQYFLEYEDGRVVLANKNYKPIDDEGGEL